MDYKLSIKIPYEPSGYNLVTNTNLYTSNTHANGRYNHTYPEFEFWIVESISVTGAYNLVNLDQSSRMKGVRSISPSPANNDSNYFEIGEKVLVGFYNRDRRRPYVIGIGGSISGPPIPQVGFEMWAQFYGHQSLSRAISLSPSYSLSDLEGAWTEIGQQTTYGSTVSHGGYLWAYDDSESKLQRISKNPDTEPTLYDITGYESFYWWTQNDLFTSTGLNDIGLYNFNSQEENWSSEWIGNLYDQLYQRNDKIWLAIKPSDDGGAPSAVCINPINGNIESTIVLEKGAVNAEYPESLGPSADFVRDELLLGVESERPWGDNYNEQDSSLSDPAEVFNVLMRGLLFTADLIVPWTIQHDSVRAHNYEGDLVWQHDGTVGLSDPTTNGETATFEILSVVQVHEASNTVLVFVAEQHYEAFEYCENPPDFGEFPSLSSKYYLRKEDISDYIESMPSNTNWYPVNFQQTSPDPADWEDNYPNGWVINDTVANLFSAAKDATDTAYGIASSATYTSELKWTWKGVRYKFRTLNLATGAVITEGDYLEDIMINGDRPEPEENEFDVIGEPPYDFASGSTDLVPSGDEDLGDNYTFTYSSNPLDLSDDERIASGGIEIPYMSGYLKYANLAALYNFSDLNPGHNIYPYIEIEDVGIIRRYTPFMWDVPNNPKLTTGFQPMPDASLVVNEIPIEYWGWGGVVRQGNLILGNGSINRANRDLGGSIPLIIEQNFQGGALDAIVWESIKIYYWTVIPTPHRIKYKTQPVPLFNPLDCVLLDSGHVFFPPARRFGNKPEQWPYANRLIVDISEYETTNENAYPAVGALLKLEDLTLTEIPFGTDVIKDFVETEQGSYYGPVPEDPDTNSTTSLPKLAAYNHENGASIYLGLSAVIVDAGSESRRTTIVRIDVSTEGEATVATDFQRESESEKGKKLDYLMLWGGEPIMRLNNKLVAIRES